MGANPSSNVFQQLWEEEPSSEAKERIEWLIFQALQGNYFILYYIIFNKIFVKKSKCGKRAPNLTSIFNLQLNKMTCTLINICLEISMEK